MLVLDIIASRRFILAKSGKTIPNVIRGDNRTINLTFLESDGSTPINLTGGTVYFTVNATQNPADDTSAAIAKVITTGFTDPTNGKHTLDLLPVDTNIDPLSYFYDAQFTDSLGNKLSSYQGKFIVQADTTRL